MIPTKKTNQFQRKLSVVQWFQWENCSAPPWTLKSLSQSPEVLKISIWSPLDETNDEERLRRDVLMIVDMPKEDGAWVQTQRTRCRRTHACFWVVWREGFKTTKEVMRCGWSNEKHQTRRVCEKVLTWDVLPWWEGDETRSLATRLEKTWRNGRRDVMTRDGRVDERKIKLKGGCWR